MQLGRAISQGPPMGNSDRKQLQKRGKAIHCLSPDRGEFGWTPR